MNQPIMIIGGGPGGISAAIQLHRSGYKPLIFESRQLGGLLVNAWRVENYPGFPAGISGLELVQLFCEQLALYHPEIVYDHVLSVEKTQSGYWLTTQKDQHFSCQYLIIATGTNPRQYTDLKLDKKEALSKRMYYEVDNIRHFKGKDISIIGGSDVAFDYAMTMSQENQVSIFMRGSKSKAIKTLCDTVQMSQQIKVYPKSEIEDLELKDDRISLNFKTGASIQNHMTDDLLFAIGRVPTMPQLVNKMAYENEKEKRVFFVGDVKNSQYRQVAFAVSDGIKAAMTIDCMIRGEQ
ncbi:MAG TPA: NAD(P)/FAD-dependent oxidoreductase [Thermotogota bacterium]|nr:NAD(P)/FAD-dependent oxidoreductase [Thermotogota bacterium]